MLIPVPLPTYTLSPALRPLEATEVAALEDGLVALAGEYGSVLVMGVGRALGRLMFEVASVDGPLLLLESAGVDARSTIG